jgi:hypothetical protein
VQCLDAQLLGDIATGEENHIENYQDCPCPARNLLAHHKKRHDDERDQAQRKIESQDLSTYWNRVHQGNDPRIENKDSQTGDVVDYVE